MEARIPGKHRSRYFGAGFRLWRRRRADCEGRRGRTGARGRARHGIWYQPFRLRTDVPQRRIRAHSRAGVKGAESAGSRYRHDNVGSRAATTSRNAFSKLRYAAYCRIRYCPLLLLNFSPMEQLDSPRMCATRPATGRSVEAGPDHATKFPGGDSLTGSPVNASIGTPWLVHVPVAKNRCVNQPMF